MVCVLNLSYCLFVYLFVCCLGIAQSVENKQPNHNKQFSGYWNLIDYLLYYLTKINLLQSITYFHDNPDKRNFIYLRIKGVMNRNYIIYETFHTNI